MSEDPSDVRPSKSQRKREFDGLQRLAERMVALTDAELDRLGVAGPLRQAIAQVRPMRPSGARNRQIKHCVKFMDPDALGEVVAFLDNRQTQRVEANRRLHEIEHWRDRLVVEGDHALGELLATENGLDRQRLRQLCRDAQREKAEGRPAGAGRRLFRFLRDELGQ